MKKETSDLKGALIIGGTISIAGPGLVGRLSKGEGGVFKEEDKNIELYLKMANSKTEEIREATPWISLVEADVEIVNKTAEDGESLTGDCYIEIKSGKDRCLGLSMTVEQARILADMLHDYVQAFDSWQRCATVKTIVRASV